MKKVPFLLVAISLFPSLTHAASLQEDIKNILTFANTVVLPFILGIAFVFVVFNAVRFFVFEGATEDGQKKAKALAVYGVLAFVVIIIFWGIVNLLASSFGYAGQAPPSNDYVDTYKGINAGTGGSGATPKGSTPVPPSSGPGAPNPSPGAPTNLLPPNF